MSDINVSVPGGKRKRLKIAGTYCEQDVLVTAEKPMPIAEKEVNFYDFDGTLLYAYTIEEAQALTELPPIPAYHEHLIPFKWNWSLEEVQTIDNDADIGALYKTEDNATYMGIEFLDDNPTPLVLNFSGTPDIDWGDGTETKAATNGVSHNYSAAGNYEIKITGNITIGGGTEATAFVPAPNYRKVTYVYVGEAHTTTACCFANFSRMKRVSNLRELLREQFKNCYSLQFYTMCTNDLGYGAFRECWELKLIAMIKNLNYVHGESLRGCHSLKRFPSRSWILTDGSYHFMNCYLLEKINIHGVCGAMAAYACHVAKKLTVHEGVTSIGEQAFYNCFSYEVATIASTVTSIGAQAFQNNSSMRRMQIKAITPPTVANSNAFASLGSLVAVEVPAESLEAYQNATNYASIASKMVGVNSFD